MKNVNKQWLLKSRPEGDVKPDHFELVETPIPELEDGQMLVRHLYLSIDPTNRIWLNEEDSYLPAVQIGEVMRGAGIGIVEQSRNKEFEEGDIVSGLMNWQTYLVSDGEGLGKMDVQEGVPLTAYQGLFGIIGGTAYVGLMDIGKPKAGETLVVSAAAGAVGSIVGQMGKKEGCRVVGLAGSDDKCRWLTEELGFDAAINYKTENVAESLAKHCPDGIDIYFENVGGEILDAVLELINHHARIPLCGLISTYNDDEPSPGLRNMNNLLVKSVTMKGYIMIDYLDRMQEAMEYLVPAYQAGEIKYRVDVVDGFDKAPEALNMLFAGKNRGKLIVKIDQDWVEVGD